MSGGVEPQSRTESPMLYTGLQYSISYVLLCFAMFSVFLSIFPYSYVHQDIMLFKIRPFKVMLANNNLILISVFRVYATNTNGSRGFLKIFLVYFSQTTFLQICKEWNREICLNYLILQNVFSIILPLYYFSK